MNEFAKALLAENPNPGLREKLSLFGQFVGEWDLDGVYARGTPDEWHVPGEWLFSWILDGTAIQDTFICPSRKEQAHNPHPDAEYGTTVRFYNPDKHVWDICYGGYGYMYVLEARQVGGQIIVANKDDAGGMNQWVFSDITPVSFHWQNRTSYDGGGTWQVNFEVFASKRQT